MRILALAVLTLLVGCDSDLETTYCVAWRNDLATIEACKASANCRLTRSDFELEQYAREHLARDCKANP